jgi:EAL domain-containing protein (putative c-di-GMP-specific phosphodiesterase class I)
VVGIEALLRWQIGGTPGKFIPFMDVTGMILEVGAWALRQAALDHRRWQEQVPGTAHRRHRAGARPGALVRKL